MSGLGVTILVVSFLVLIAGLFAVIVERTNERDEARENAARAGRERDAADAIIARLEDDNMRMAAELAARGSNVVPFQRSGDHDALPESGEVSGYAWPRIARRIEHDDLTALMRATEEQ